MNTPSTQNTDELDVILRDLQTTGRSCAADRAIRAAHAALAARSEAHAEIQRISREARKLATATRRQLRRELVDAARARHWADRQR